MNDRTLHVLVSGLVAYLMASAGQGQTIKMASVAPKDSPWHNALVDIGEQWKEISAGKVKLRIYPGGVVGDEPDMLRKIRIGQLHAAALSTTGLISVTPDIEGLSFPLDVRTDEEMEAVIERVGPIIEKQLEERGFKVLTWTLTGWVHFFSKERVLTPDDLRHRKLFFWGSDSAYVGLLKKLGFQPVSLTLTDLLPSLQTGLVDTFGAPPVAALSFQWFGMAKHMSSMRWQPMPGMVVISTKQWSRIPAEYRPAMEKAARDVGAALRVRARELEEEAVKVMQDHGLTVHTTPPEAEEEFRALLKEHGFPIFIGKRFSREVHDEVKAALEDLRNQPAVE
jgi:TRAP-type C4-dicarboxylate transport system substrate-binding protein